uniref:Restriction endonuclease n=1 Tax=Candidatus Kentrum sp. MB TaxID=2138164 RepID=A0A451BEB5_9GAMM|nr:MAG: hypothetical protein BECKMB1821G_GA0114241_106926 [Candidatus Kentron sp. MB]VFK34264.1 MAG: hypothetical protein BECKMB1821I_GA0114274_106625 [Candidatus Kentron sp. MB]VFK76624.1 MAG: hypothetical protein BECKMB1821H_GA0114242_106527 [Candidatus Kentron sp. MB]
MIDFRQLQFRYGDGASDIWERICISLVQREHLEAKAIRASPGDGGIDCILEREGDVTIWQCKYFIKNIGESQKNQIRESIQSLKKSGCVPNKWVLCLPIDLSLKERAWWDNFRLNHGFLLWLWEGSQIRTELLKTENSATRDEYFHENNKSSLEIEIVNFKENLDDYQVHIRIYNALAIGKTAIFTRLFVEVESISDHDFQMSKVFYGAPIGKIEIEKDKVFHFRPIVAKWEIYKEDRKFPPNEVEDFEFKFSIENGKVYTLRFGATWYIPGDKTIRKSFSKNWYTVGSPEDIGYSDTYSPPHSFIDPPRIFEHEYNDKTIA